MSTPADTKQILDAIAELKMQSESIQHAISRLVEKIKVKEPRDEYDEDSDRSEWSEDSEDSEGYGSDYGDEDYAVDMRYEGTFCMCRSCLDNHLKSYVNYSDDRIYYVEPGLRWSGLNKNGDVVTIFSLLKKVDDNPHFYDYMHVEADNPRRFAYWHREMLNRDLTPRVKKMYIKLDQHRGRFTCKCGKKVELDIHNCTISERCIGHPKHWDMVNGCVWCDDVDLMYDRFYYVNTGS